MLQNNFYLYSLKIIGELFFSILMFPLWWYARGFLNFVQGVAGFWQDRQRALALSVWTRNIFTPMYGQRDWQGIMISIFMRLIQIVFRGSLMLVFLAAGILLIFLWLAAPLLVIYQIFFQLS